MLHGRCMTVHAPALSCGWLRGSLASAPALTSRPFAPALQTAALNGVAGPASELAPGFLTPAPAVMPTPAISAPTSGLAALALPAAALHGVAGSASRPTLSLQHKAGEAGSGMGPGSLSASVMKDELRSRSLSAHSNKPQLTQWLEQVAEVERRAWRL